MKPFRKKGRSVSERFFDFALPEPNSGCWLWTGALFGSGYGSFKSDDKQTHAHRFSWELHYGPIPDGLLACHKCDVRCCVNPEHLFLGTHKDNNADMWSKGRGRPVHGEAHPKARLSVEDVAAICMDNRSLREIGVQYGVDKQYIWRIKRGEHWRSANVTNPEEAQRQARGKMIRHKGETHHKAKLTVPQVLAIRNDTRPAREVGKLYGVSKHNVLCIRHRKIWAHV